jgi:hypothetical protein
MKEHSLAIATVAASAFASALGGKWTARSVINVLARLEGGPTITGGEHFERQPSAAGRISGHQVQAA